MQIRGGGGEGINAKPPHPWVKEEVPPAIGPCGTRSSKTRTAVPGGPRAASRTAVAHGDVGTGALALPLWGGGAPTESAELARYPCSQAWDPAPRFFFPVALLICPRFGDKERRKEEEEEAWAVRGLPAAAPGFCDSRLQLPFSSDTRAAFAQRSGCAASVGTSYVIKQDVILRSKD